MLLVEDLIRQHFFLLITLFKGSVSQRTHRSISGFASKIGNAFGVCSWITQYSTCSILVDLKQTSSGQRKPTSGSGGICLLRVKLSLVGTLHALMIIIFTYKCILWFIVLYNFWCANHNLICHFLCLVHNIYIYFQVLLACSSSCFCNAQEELFLGIVNKNARYICA